jgi:hypothetical protein
MCRTSIETETMREKVVYVKEFRSLLLPSHNDHMLTNDQTFVCKSIVYFFVSTQSNIDLGISKRESDERVRYFSHRCTSFTFRKGIF